MRFFIGQSDTRVHPLDDAEWCLIARRLELSPREADVVVGVFSDEKEQTIALRLGISPHTVHAHLKRIYMKLGVASRVALVTRVFSEYVALARQGNLPSAHAPQFTIRRAA